MGIGPQSKLVPPTAASTPVAVTQRFASRVLINTRSIRGPPLMNTRRADITFFFFFFFFILGKNKALAHHTSTYFHTRRVSISLSCFRSPTLAGAPFGSHCRYSVSCPYQWSSLQPRQRKLPLYKQTLLVPGISQRYRLVRVRNPIFFPGECPRRFFDLDREIVHTSYMCPCKELTRCFFFFFCLS